jgi:hypothetical protein
MAEVMARLFHLTGDLAWRHAAGAVLRAFAGQADQLAGMPTLLAAADLLEEAATVVIAGTASAPLLQAALRAPDPAVVALRTTEPDTLRSNHPAFGKTQGAGGSTAFLCRRAVCSLPVTQPDALAWMVRTRV